jgi:hypothetical protein
VSSPEIARGVAAGQRSAEAPQDVVLRPLIGWSFEDHISRPGLDDLSAQHEHRLVRDPVCLLTPAGSKANHPDNVVYAGGKVWVGWQNITAKDGFDNKSSTIGEYATSGKLVKSWSLGGPTAGTGCHTDGMREDPVTHLVWVMCNEDGNPRLYTIDPASSTATQITLPKTPHGGGFDDIQFLNGMAFIDASNPTLNSAGANVFPALYKITISGSTASLTPVLKGGATGTTLNPPVSSITMPLTDPDSMMIDPQGDLVLDGQADQQLLFIHNAGTAGQTVKVLPVGTPLDDTMWPTSSKGCMIIADNASGVFTVCRRGRVPSINHARLLNEACECGSGQALRWPGDRHRCDRRACPHYLRDHHRRRRQCRPGEGSALCASTYAAARMAHHPGQPAR